MKQIQLTKGYFTTVDDQDFDYLSQFNWGVQINRKRKYAYRKFWDSITRKSYTMYMHRDLHNLVDSKIHVDHVDGNGLNNQRVNLRLCSNAQNLMNVPMKKNNKCGLKGVYWETSRQKWKAEIRVNKRKQHLGRFASKYEAAEAYNKAAIKYFGEFAYINEIQKKIS